MSGDQANASVAAAPVSTGIEKAFVDGLSLMHLRMRGGFGSDRALVGEVRVPMMANTTRATAGALIGLRRQRQHVLVMVAVGEVVLVRRCGRGRAASCMTG